MLAAPVYILQGLSAAVELDGRVEESLEAFSADRLPSAASSRRADKDTACVPTGGF